MDKSWNRVGSMVRKQQNGRLRKSRTRVLVCDANGKGCANKSLEERMRVAAKIRANGIGVEYLYPSQSSLEGVIEYCHERGIAYLVVLKLKRFLENGRLTLKYVQNTEFSDREGSEMS